MKQQWCLVLAFVVLIGSGTVSAVNTAQTTVITELFYDTYLKGDTDGEFIRIHNPTETTICLGGDGRLPIAKVLLRFRHRRI